MQEKSTSKHILIVTNDLHRRIYEHEHEFLPGFTKKYNCHYLIYYEHFQQIEHAIDREKQIKRWSRKKKEFIIKGTSI